MVYQVKTISLGLAETSAKMLVESICMLKEGAIVQAYVMGDLNAAQKARQICSRFIAAIN